MQALIESIIRSRAYAARHLGLGLEDLRSVATVASLEALRSWDPDRGASRETWCWRLASQAVSRELRSAAQGLAEDDPDIADLEDAGEDPENLAILRDALRVLRARLDPHDYRLLWMVGEGWTAADLADYHGMSQGAMRVRICRARKSAVTILGAPSIT
jgi:RNA polymerase sigma factor (sigma-70 family)